MLKYVYLALAAIGTVLPWFYFASWFMEFGWDLGAMVDDWNRTDAGTGLVYDLTVAWIALREGARTIEILTPVAHVLELHDLAQTAQEHIRARHLMRLGHQGIPLADQPPRPRHIWRSRNWRNLGICVPPTLARLADRSLEGFARKRQRIRRSKRPQ